jgi:hypothetical protein
MAQFREDAAAQESGWREAEVLRLGALGASRAEMAAALDLSLAGLTAAAAASPALAEALGRAMTRAQAWWEAIPREALAAGVRFSFGPWEREMRRRFGPAAEAEAEAEEVEEDDHKDFVWKEKWGWVPRICLPCNGRTRRRPDGSCPCSAYHNQAYWRAYDDEDDDEDADERPDDEDDGDDDWDEDEDRAPDPIGHRETGLSSRLEDRDSDPEGRDLLCAGGDEQVPDRPLARPSGMTGELELDAVPPGEGRDRNYRWFYGATGPREPAHSRLRGERVSLGNKTTAGRRL